MIPKTSFLLFLLFRLLLGASEPLSFHILSGLNLETTLSTGVEYSKKDYVSINYNNLLSEWNGRDVLIRGFIYETENGWVLSPEPELKSCCMGKQPLNRIIFLGEDLVVAEGLRMADIEGVFSVFPVTDSEGRVRELFHIQNPRALPVEKTEILQLVASIGCLILLAAIWGVVQMRVTLSSCPKKVT